MPDYLPNKELELEAWVDNFVTVAESSLTVLGLTTADMAPVHAADADFISSLANIVSVRAQLDGVMRDKDVARKSLETVVRALSKRIQAHPGVSDGLKAQLGINVPNPVKNRTAPVMPSEVSAKPEAVGVNVLKWSKAGNKTTTQYVILAKTLTNGARITDEAGWNIVGQTTRAKFAHTNVTPGVPMAYKVMAARADQASLPSLPATVYGG